VHEIVFSNKVYSSFTETKEKLSVDFTECNADVESVLVELSRNGFPFFILFQCGEIFAPDKPRITEALCDVFKDKAVPLELENQEQLESGQKNKKTNLCHSINLMTEFLKKKNYEIEKHTNEVTVVKRSDDPWNEFNKFVAKSDGVYNFIERQMSGYELTKRLVCNSIESSCFVILAYFCAMEVSKEMTKTSEEEIVLTEIKRNIGSVLENVSDYHASRCFIDTIIKMTEGRN
jgi:hypothetical protein